MTQEPTPIPGSCDDCTKAALCPHKGRRVLLPDEKGRPIKVELYWCRLWEGDGPALTTDVREVYREVGTP